MKYKLFKFSILPSQNFVLVIEEDFDKALITLVKSLVPTNPNISVLISFCYDEKYKILFVRKESDSPFFSGHREIEYLYNGEINETGIYT